MNDPIIQLQAKLDKAKASQSLNNDIQEIQLQLNQLKVQAEIDPQSISALNKQLDHLLVQKIITPDIAVDEAKVQQIGQNIGNTLSTNLTESIRKASAEITSEIKKSEDQVSNIQPSPNGIIKVFDIIKNKISEFDVAGKIENIGKGRMSVRISKYC